MKFINTILGIVALATAVKIDGSCQDKGDAIIQALSSCHRYAIIGARAARAGDRITKYFKVDSDHVRNHVAETYDRIAKECATSDSGISTIHCQEGPEQTNPREGCEAGWSAYTAQDFDKIIYCPLYFDFPAGWPGVCHVGDQGGITLHEITHLDLGDGFGMKDDWAYGAEDCMALGADRALENADTYQQYAQEIAFCANWLGIFRRRSGGF